VKHLIYDVILTVGFITLALDSWRLRRRLRVDRLAREVEEALGPPRIGDIDMPDPSDPRWKPADMSFITNGVSRKEQVLALGSVTVAKDGDVYIGTGPAIDGGKPYGKRVLHAYRRRLVEESRGSS
jgi:hypothetical protein